MKYATATTLAGRRRQVWDGRAEMTGPGGLTRAQLTENSQGKIVSLAKSLAMGSAGLQGGGRRLRPAPAGKNFRLYDGYVTNWKGRTAAHQKYLVKGKPVILYDLPKEKYVRVPRTSKIMVESFGAAGGRHRIRFKKIYRTISQEDYDSIVKTNQGPLWEKEMSKPVRRYMPVRQARRKSRQARRKAKRSGKKVKQTRRRSSRR